MIAFIDLMHCDLFIMSLLHLFNDCLYSVLWVSQNPIKTLPQYFKGWMLKHVGLYEYFKHMGVVPAKIEEGISGEPVIISPIMLPFTFCLSFPVEHYAISGKV